MAVVEERRERREREVEREAGGILGPDTAAVSPLYTPERLHCLADTRHTQLASDICLKKTAMQMYKQKFSQNIIWYMCIIYCAVFSYIVLSFSWSKDCTQIRMDWG